MHTLFWLQCYFYPPTMMVWIYTKDESLINIDVRLFITKYKLENISWNLKKIVTTVLDSGLWHQGFWYRNHSSGLWHQDFWYRHDYIQIMACVKTSIFLCLFQPQLREHKMHLIPSLCKIEDLNASAIENHSLYDCITIAFDT